MKMLIARALVALQDGAIAATHRLINTRLMRWADDLLYPQPEEPND